MSSPRLCAFLVILVLTFAGASASCRVDGSSAFGTCVYLCEDIGWDDGLHPGHQMVNNVLNNLNACPWGGFFEMRFDNCSFPEGRLDVDWFTHDPTKIFGSLHFESCNLKSIDDGALSSYQAFQNNLQSFGVAGSPEFTSLSVGMLQGATSPLMFDFDWSNNGIIENVDAELFQLFPNLKNLHLSEDGLGSVDILANMTGQCQTTPHTQFIYIGINKLLPGFGIPVLSNKLFSAVSFDERSSIYLYEAGIEFFEDNTVLDNFSKGVTFPSFINLRNNKLKNIPSGSFDRLIDSNVDFLISLSGNPWHCDCNLQYVQDVIKSTSNMLSLEFPSLTLCASPPSQAGLPILEADMSTECEPLPQPPTIDIQC